MSVAYTVNAGFNIRHYVGKSTDEKPIEDVPNGSDFYEMDQVGGEHRIFMFDADTNTWLKQ